jgi:tetratricopeptide (TPR) repeat protein
MMVVDANLGNALLKLKRDPQAALASFREGVRNDPENTDLYFGLDAAMSLTGVSAVERAGVLSQYPVTNAPDSKMPSNLVYQLALARAEAGQYDQALALFNDRFFPREEGEITSEQTLLEIKLLQAEAWAKAHNCTEAEGFLADEQTEMSLHGGSPREYVKLGGIARSCGHTKESEELLHKAVASADSQGLAWVIQAQKSLGTYDSAKANKRIAELLPAVESHIETGTYTGLWWYVLGTMQAALGREEQAKESFEKALLLPDTSMSHHLVREALAGIAAGK